MLGTWFCEHPDCTARDILSLLYLRTNVLVVSCFGRKRLLNGLDVYFLNARVSIIKLKVLTVKQEKACPKKLRQNWSVGKQFNGSVALSLCSLWRSPVGTVTGGGPGRVSSPPSAAPSSSRVPPAYVGTGRPTDGRTHSLGPCGAPRH